TPIVLSFFFYYYRAHRVLHSFPTRRSSDLSRRSALLAFLLLVLLRAVRRLAVDIKCLTPGRAGKKQGTDESYAWSQTFDINGQRSEEHTSELQSPCNLVCRLLLEKKKISRD